MCPNFPQYDSTRGLHIPRPPPRPEGLRQGIRDPNIPFVKPVITTKISAHAIEAESATSRNESPHAAPRRPKRPDIGSHASRGEALRRPDLDPRRAHHFSRPAVPTTFSWEQLPKPPSANAWQPRPQDAMPGLDWATAFKSGRTPMSIRENGRPGETLVANWPSKPRKRPAEISAVDALHDAEEIRFRLLRSNAIAVVRRGALSFFATVAFGEKGGSPARFTSAGTFLPASMKEAVRDLLRENGLVTARGGRRFDATLERCKSIEQDVRRHIAAAHDAAARQAWTVVRAELAAANDATAPLRNPAAAIRLGPALDPDLYGQDPHPKTRRRDAENAIKGILARLAHAERRIWRIASQQEETFPLAAE